MKIAAYTIGGIERASSRLRSFYLFSTANQYNVEVIRPTRYLDALSADIDLVHIQKIVSIKLIPAIVFFRLKGLKVVYDVDDQPGRPNIFLGGLIFLSYFFAALFSSYLTVDTEARKQYWKKYLPLKKIIVVNDVADTVESRLKIFDRSNISFNDTFFWIGYSLNLKSISVFLEYLRSSNKYKLVVSTEEKSIKKLKEKYQFIDFIPWFDGVSYSSEIKAKYMILNHDIDDASLMKSENKMVLAILSGYIPIVSRTPAYEKLAKLLDAEFLLFDQFDDINNIIDNTREMDFKKFFKSSITVLNKYYSKDSVFLSFCDSIFDTKLF